MKSLTLVSLLLLAGCATAPIITRCDLQPTPEMMPRPAPPNSPHCHEHCAGRMWDGGNATYACLNDDCSDWRQAADHIPTPVFPWCTIDGCEFLDVATHRRSSIGAACIDTPTCTQWEWMDAYGIWLCDVNGCTRKALPSDSKAGQGAVVPRTTSRALIIGAAMGSAKSYGYDDPYVSARARLETLSPRILASLGGDYSPTPKTQAGDGYSLGYNASAYLRARALIIGGTLDRATTRNSEWTKSALRYLVSIGIDTPHFRVLASKESSLSDPNHLHGWQFNARVRMTSAMWLTYSVFSSRFDRTSATSATGYLVGAEYVFGGHA